MVCILFFSCPVFSNLPLPPHTHTFGLILKRILRHPTETNQLIGKMQLDGRIIESGVGVVKTGTAAGQHCSLVPENELREKPNGDI